MKIRFQRARVLQDQKKPNLKNKIPNKKINLGFKNMFRKLKRILF